MPLDNNVEQGLEGLDDVASPLKAVLFATDPMDVTKLGSQASRHTMAKLKKLGKQQQINLKHLLEE
eukprot:7903096-Ditylum_brightwellii.AAC.2